MYRFTTRYEAESVREQFVLMGMSCSPIQSTGQEYYFEARWR